MSSTPAKGERKIGLRDQREPGHCWVDNEIFDVFGDRLGANGILLYLTMARLCWGVEVRRSLREIAAHARMSKSTVDRAMKGLVTVGLIEEERGEKTKTAICYRLVNAKQLAKRYVAEALPSVPPGDSASTPPVGPKSNSFNQNGLAEMPTLVQLLCPTGGQIAPAAETVDKKISPQDSGTDLSHPDANLSHTRGPFNTQDSRPQDSVHPPTPHGGSGALKSFSSVDGVLAEQVRSEVRRVMRERNLSAAGLQAAIERAMWQAMEGSGDRPSEVADVMIHNHGLYITEGPRLRFTWGPRKFFDEGHWRNWKGWPLDQKLVAAARRL